MASASVLGRLVIAPPRKSRAQQMDDWELDNNDDALLEEFDKIDKMEEASIGHRWGSKSTLSAQDRVLRDYRRFTSIYLKKKHSNHHVEASFSAGDDCNDRFIFPGDSELLMKYIRR
jgi:hypothetical protein